MTIVFMEGGGVIFKEYIWDTVVLRLGQRCGRCSSFRMTLDQCFMAGSVIVYRTNLWNFAGVIL